MSRYAKGTKVPQEQTLQEIQKVLKKYGAQKFGYMSDISFVVIAFEMHNRRIRINLKILKNETDQNIRQKWRALLLIIKSKLEAIESKIESFDEAFLAHIVLPNGQTMSEYSVPHIEKSYQSGNMPPLLGLDS